MEVVNVVSSAPSTVKRVKREIVGNKLTSTEITVLYLLTLGGMLLPLVSRLCLPLESVATSIIGDESYQYLDGE